MAGNESHQVLWQLLHAARADKRSYCATSLHDIDAIHTYINDASHMYAIELHSTLSESEAARGMLVSIARFE